MEDRLLLLVTERRSWVLVYRDGGEAYRRGLFVGVHLFWYEDRDRRNFANSNLSYRPSGFCVQVVRRLGDGALLHVTKLGAVVTNFFRFFRFVNRQVVANRSEVARALWGGAFIQLRLQLCVRRVDVSTVEEYVRLVGRVQVCVLMGILYAFRGVSVGSLINCVVFRFSARQAHLRARIRVLYRRGNFRLPIFFELDGQRHAQRGAVVYNFFQGQLMGFLLVLIPNRRVRDTFTESR